MWNGTGFHSCVKMDRSRTATSHYGQSCGRSIVTVLRHEFLHDGLDDLGHFSARPLGSRIAMPFAKETLANYVTETIRGVVRAEVLDAARSDGRLYREPRVFEDLLSSQPLCFNLFGELQQDLALASRTFQSLLDEPRLRVTAIEFKHSPGRGDPRFTNDGSAFDVFVSYARASGGNGFVGIEVKFVENLDVPPARRRARYDAVSDAMGVFLPENRGVLRSPPLEQIWRDHLLAGSLILNAASGFERGSFAVVYPSGNTIVGAAVRAYGACLRDRSTFHAWALEEMLATIQTAGSGDWVREVRERSLFFAPASSLRSSTIDRRRRKRRVRNGRSSRRRSTRSKPGPSPRSPTALAAHRRATTA